MLWSTLPPFLMAPANSTQHLEGFMNFWVDSARHCKGTEEDLVTIRWHRGGSKMSEGATFLLSSPSHFWRSDTTARGEGDMEERHAKLTKGYNFLPQNDLYKLKWQ